MQPTVSMEITYDLLCLSKTIRTVQRISLTSPRFVSCAISHIGSTSPFFVCLFVFHTEAEQEAIKLILFCFTTGKTPIAPLALDYVNAKTKVYNFLLFFFLNFLTILYLMYIMNIYKYIYTMMILLFTIITR